MKKMIAILLTVLMLMLSGCSAIPDAYGGSSLNLQNANGVAGGLYKQVSFREDYNVYLKYINTVDWPYGFAEWRDLDFLGEWTGFGIPPSAEGLPDYTFYWYTFTDDSGRELMIYVDHTLDDKEVSAADTVRPVVSISDEMTSMRNLSISRTENMMIMRNGFEYTYVPAGLLSITWVHNGVEYTISDSTALSEYPTEATNTFIGRLLSLDDAAFKQALAEIKPDAAN